MSKFIIMSGTNLRAISMITLLKNTVLSKGKKQPTEMRDSSGSHDTKKM